MVPFLTSSRSRIIEVNEIELDTEAQVVTRALAQYQDAGEVPDRVRDVLPVHEGLVAREGEELLSVNEGVEIDRESVRRRFETLADAGLVNIDRDGIESPYPANPWVACLSDAGEEWVQENWDRLGADKGSIGSRVADNSARITKVESRMDGVSDSMASMPDADAITGRVDDLENETDATLETFEDKIRENTDAIESVEDRVDDLETKMDAMMAALESTNLDVEAFIDAEGGSE
ncbi:hypothetical protein ACFO0N_07290 [Halobium salinum]|uniref:Uncharacterized protein n=1 Tax=Halobium salinum TaxID=1364940 RepID=A0ABD5PAC4_9EURY|nr:hypothetical protein [Halobium salinum]